MQNRSHEVTRPNLFAKYIWQNMKETFFQKRIIANLGYVFIDVQVFMKPINYRCMGATIYFALKRFYELEKTIMTSGNVVNLWHIPNNYFKSN